MTTITTDLGYSIEVLEGFDRDAEACIAVQDDEGRRINFYLNVASVTLLRDQLNELLGDK